MRSTLTWCLLAAALSPLVACGDKDGGGGDTGTAGGDGTDGDDGSDGSDGTDGDGGPDPAEVDNDGDGFSELRGDCDDSNPLVYPRAPERCNGIDDDCDSKIDDDDADVTDTEAWYEDLDGDGYGTDQTVAQACEAPDGFVDNDTDCNDDDPAINPELVWYVDNDFDSFGSDAFTLTSCEQPSGYVDNADDCDDSSAVAYPGAEEIWYDGVDGDCSGGSDNDADLDGHDAVDAGGDDCDDTDPAVNPSATEICNGIDDQCDGEIDADDDDLDISSYLTFYIDGDGDGYGDPAGATHTGCEAPSGYADNPDDCLDTDVAYNPAATDLWYDGEDHDCQENDDYDADMDGYRSESYAAAATFQAGTEVVAAGAAPNTDCNDADAAFSPGAAETWYDGIDQNCDPTDEYDADGDGHDSDGHGGGDCDDTDSSVSPSAEEVCNDGIDNDCSGDAPECGIPATGSHSDADLAFTSASTGDDAGDAVSARADLDGDGLADVAMGIPGAAGGGAVALRFGGASGASSTPDATLTDSGATGELGAALTAVPDVDGDGYDELLVGCDACEPTGLGTDIGGVHLVLGPVSGTVDLASGADATFTGTANYGGLGSALSASRDFDGDGTVDFLLGEVNTAQAYLVLGAASGGGDVATAAATTFTGTGLDALGGAVGAGDFDGDGDADALLGAPGLDAVASNAGGVYLAYGPLSSTVDLSTGVSIAGRSASAGFGSTVAVGDLDGDGTDDWIAASPAQAGSVGSGAVYGFVGAVTTSTSTSGASFSITAGATDALGESLAIGDLDGAGQDDVVGGAPDDDYYGSGGALFVWYGPVSTGALSVGGADAIVVGSATGFAAGLDIGDVDGDGIDDLTVSGASSGSIGGAWTFFGGGM